MVGTAQSIEITKVSYHGRVLMYACATRGLGFLVCCAMQLGQGTLRSGGSPFFMINHMPSYVERGITYMSLLCYKVSNDTMTLYDPRDPLVPSSSIG